MHLNGWAIFFFVVAIICVILFVLYKFGDKQQKKQEESRRQLYDNMQVVSMLVIDKKHMKLSEAGFPRSVTEQMKKRYLRSKAPVVKCKIGPQIVSLLCDEAIYDQIPVKTEIKAQVSGLYIMGIKNTRNVAPPEPEKKNFFQKLTMKQNSMTEEAMEDKPMTTGKNVKAMQSASKGQMKNKAYNPSAKKNKSTKKKKNKSKKKKH